MSTESSRPELCLLSPGSSVCFCSIIASVDSSNSLSDLNNSSGASLDSFFICERTSGERCEPGSGLRVSSNFNDSLLEPKDLKLVVS